MSLATYTPEPCWRITFDGRCIPEPTAHEVAPGAPQDTDFQPPDPWIVAWMVAAAIYALTVYIVAADFWRD